MRTRAGLCIVAAIIVGGACGDPPVSETVDTASIEASPTTPPPTGSSSTPEVAPDTAATTTVPTTVATTEPVPEETTPSAPVTSAPPQASGLVDLSADGLTATLGYQHPSLGPTTIEIVRGGGGGEFQRFLPSVRATVDATGEIIFDWSADVEYDAFDFWGLSPDDGVDTTYDDRGHVFFKWNPGRFTGTSVLVPTADGFDSIDTLTDDFGDFYYSFVVDVNGDGVFELEQNFQICEPDCAGGIYYSHIWEWDGTTYSGRSDPPDDSSSPTPAPDATISLDDGVAAIRDYLLTAGARSYDDAWSSLSAAYQDEYGSYDAFVAFWERVDNVGIDSTAFLGEAGGGITIEVELRYALRDGSTSREVVHIDIDRRGGELIIDDYRFIRQL